MSGYKLTEKHLKRASEAVALTELSKFSGLPDHHFSETFEYRMAEMVDAVSGRKRPSRKLSRIAVILVVVFVLTSCLLLHPQARAAVSGWIQETFGIRSSFRYSSEASPETARIELTWLPEEYRLIRQESRDNGGIAVYQKDDREETKIVFEYLFGAAGSLFETVPLNDSYTYQESTDDSVEYLTVIGSEQGSNTLLWLNEDAQLVCILTSQISVDTLMQILNNNFQNP